MLSTAEIGDYNTSLVVLKRTQRFDQYALIFIRNTIPSLSMSCMKIFILKIDLFAGVSLTNKSRFGKAINSDGNYNGGGREKDPYDTMDR